MHENGLRPSPPQWALEAGLPEPFHGEGFSEYVKRIGLDPGLLLEELQERTLCLANLRLATTLQRALPDAFDRHVDKLAASVLGPDRKYVEHNARVLFGDSFRRPKRGVSLPPS